jgi:HSP90 family molecular chaperone
MAPKNNFNFEISLSVLNHLGRNLYRNSITVLGEAISNSWDADAKNVWITIDNQSGSFTIKDDGTGMDADDFQRKFLKIGYTKRADGKMQTPGKRPFIGAKGIGKLALLSCAERITIFSKKRAKPMSEVRLTIRASTKPSRTI